MKIKIITTIVHEVDLQLKDWDLLEGICKRTYKTTKQWAEEIFENPTVEVKSETI